TPAAEPLRTSRQQRSKAELLFIAAIVLVRGKISAATCYQRRPYLVVVLDAEVGDELFPFEPAERVLQLHQLNEQVVFGGEAGRRHRALEIEGKPFLDAVHVRALGEV